MSSLWERTRAAYRAFRWPYEGQESGYSLFAIDLPDEPRLRYEALDLYKHNLVYRRAQKVLLATSLPDDYGRIRALENPSLQAVDFHVMHVFPGALTEALPFEGEGALVEAANRVLVLSNMGAQKDLAVEYQATYGDVFWKAFPKEDGSEVSLEARHPGEVVEFREDNRRNITRIRLDVKLEKENPDDPGWWTEIWDKAENSYEAWRHDLGYAAKPDSLGRPETENNITDFGHDFVPFVRAPFSNGTRPNERSRGVFELHLEAIDQINRVATELDEMYRENAEGVFVALRNQIGEDPIDFKDAEEQKTTEEVRYGRRIISMPGMSRMDDMVPSIDYKAGLDKIEDRRQALERSMSELRYFRGHDKGDPSAAAMRAHAGPAIKRAESARGSAEDALLKAIKMCLSMGQARRVFAGDIGAYDQGGFDALAFEKRPIFPESPQERAETADRRAEIFAKYADLGMLAYYLEEEEGWPRKEAERIAELAQGRRSGVATTVEDILGGAVR